jgi:Protein of unknown function (DUF3887)
MREIARTLQLSFYHCLHTMPYHFVCSRPSSFRYAVLCCVAVCVLFAVEVEAQLAPVQNSASTSTNASTVVSQPDSTALAGVQADSLTSALKAALDSIPPENHIQRAQALLEMLHREQYDVLAAEFDTNAVRGVTAAKLAEIWKPAAKLGGAFRRVVYVSTEEFSTSELILLEAEFTRFRFDVKFSFSTTHTLIGFGFTSAQLKHKLPDYVRAENVQEIPCAVRTVVQTATKKTTYKLPAILTLPSGTTASLRAEDSTNNVPNAGLPVAVILHGQGSEDKDRTRGAYKPNKDIAWGLAMKGIACLRYDKRSHGYKVDNDDVMRFTVKDAIIDDAISALRLVRSFAAQYRLDTTRIVLIAPTLSGMLIPRILAADSVAQVALQTPPPRAQVVVQDTVRSAPKMARKSARQKKTSTNTKPSQQSARAKAAESAPQKPLLEIANSALSASSATAATVSSTINVVPVRGVVMLALSYQRLQDLLKPRFMHFYGADGISEEEREELTKIERRLDAIRTNLYVPAPPSAFPYDAPGSYWQDLQRYNHVEAIAKSTISMLLLHGEQDYDVAFAPNFLEWEKKLTGKTNVEMKRYPTLFHLFAEGTGVLKDYDKQANVSPQVVDDIAAWIAKAK